MFVQFKLWDKISYFTSDTMVQSFNEGMVAQFYDQTFPGKVVVLQRRWSPVDSTVTEHTFKFNKTMGRGKIHHTNLNEGTNGSILYFGRLVSGKGSHAHILQID